VELVQSLAWANQVDSSPLQTLAEPRPGGGHRDWRCEGRHSSALGRQVGAGLETITFDKTR
jgi:hypothetical protein